MTRPSERLDISRQLVLQGTDLLAQRAYKDESLFAGWLNTYDRPRSIGPRPLGMLLGKQIRDLTSASPHDVRPHKVALHLAFASVAIEAMSDPHGAGPTARATMFETAAGAGGFPNGNSAAEAASIYADGVVSAFEAGAVAMNQGLEGEQVTLIVTAWYLARVVWSTFARTTEIRKPWL